jgi:hypothetical protein
MMVSVLVVITLGCNSIGNSEVTNGMTDAANGLNRLSGETSAYLLAHSDNPVNWYPWGDEAFAAAEAEDKPIFLSIGYSSCHWCHVMEEESFQDPEVAALMNDAFVCIKVDREERPDIDNLYMRFTTAMTGGGGWPMTVIMTPEGDPFFTATYIPKNTSFGRTGMMELIPAVVEQWDGSREEIVARAAEIGSIVLHNAPASGISSREPSTGIADSSFSAFRSSFDSEYGGFGTAPKFPSPHNLLFLLRYRYATGESEALDMVRITLRAIRSGGVFDHLGFGVHRYSTDREWLVPHFEKMLYDQALLTMAYLEAYQATGEQFFANTAIEILEYVLRDMTSTDGAFYSSEDADSEGGEGAYYTWSLDEMSRVLDSRELRLATEHWNVTESGNFTEAGTSGNRRNILHLTLEDSFSATTSPVDLQDSLEVIRRTLLLSRESRPRPFRDEKVLSDWNGLMIASMARASTVLQDPAYFNAAVEAYEFIVDRMMTDELMLSHSFAGGEKGPDGFLDDYAFLIWGCLELYNASLQEQYLHTAIELQRVVDSHFADESGGGYFFTGDYADPQIPRLKESYDGAVPSGNSVELSNLITLWKLTGDPSYLERASGIESVFSASLSTSPTTFSMMLSGVMYGRHGGTEVLLVGDSDDPVIREMLEVLRTGYRPWMTVTLMDSEDARGPSWMPDISDNPTVPAAYVCTNGACSLPVRTALELEELL